MSKIDEIFFYGDYQASDTENGKDTTGIRILRNLKKEQVEYLYNLVVNDLGVNSNLKDRIDL